jgi:hypothetical protein
MDLLQLHVIAEQLFKSPSPRLSIDLALALSMGR